MLESVLTYKFHKILLQEESCPTARFSISLINLDEQTDSLTKEKK